MITCELSQWGSHFTLHCTKVLPQRKQTAGGSMQFKTLVINLAMREIYFVLAHTTHNYACMTDLSDSDAHRSPQHFQFLVKANAEAKAVPLQAKQANNEHRSITLSILDPGLGRVGG